MATIVQRKRRDGSIAWQVQIRIAGHPSNSKSFQTRESAQQFVDRVENNVRVIAGKTQTSSELIFQQEKFSNVAQSYLLRHNITPAQKNRLLAVLPHVGEIRMGQITPSYVKKFIDRLTTSHSKTIKAPYRLSSVIQYLSAISVVYRWRALDFDISPPVGLFSNQHLPKNWNVSRDRRLAESEYEALMKKLRSPKKRNSEHWRLLVDLALETGARLQELVLSEFTEFDTSQFIWTIPALHTKGKAKRYIPLSPYACSIIGRLGKIKSDHSNRLFHCWLKPSIASRGFQDITKSAGIDDFHFHDLRHEAISRMVLYRRELSVYEIMKIVGHKSVNMLDRYANLRADEMVPRFRMGNIPHISNGLISQEPLVQASSPAT